MNETEKSTWGRSCSLFTLGRFLSFSVTLSLLIVVFYSEAIVGGKVLSSADVTLRTSVQAPKGYHWEPSHRLLSDPAFQFFPWRRVISNAIGDGEFPFLNTFNYCGAPLFANPQAALFNPLRAFGKPGENSRLWGLLNGLELFLAGVGLYLLAMELHFREPVRWLGGIIWPFSGYLVVWKLWPHSAAAWPMVWIFLGAVLIFRGKVKKGVIVTVLFLFLSWLGGHPETTCQIGLVAALYGLYLCLRSKGYKLLLVYYSSLVAGSGLVLFFLLPAAHYILNSYAWLNRVERAIPFWEIGAVHWKLLPAIAFPKMYGTALAEDLPLYTVLGALNTNMVAGGFVGWMFVLVFLPLAVMKRRSVTHFSFWFACWGITLLIAVNIPLVSNLYRSIPLLGAATPERALLFTGFSSLMLGMIGINSIFEENSCRKIFPRIGFMLVLFGILCAAFAAGMKFARPVIIDSFIQPRLQGLKLSRPAHSIVAQMDSDDFADRMEKTTVDYPLVVGTVAMLLALSMFLLKRKKNFSDLSAIGIITICALIDLFYFGRGYTPAIQMADHYADAPALRFLRENIEGYRLAATGSEVFPPNVFSAYGLRDIRGYDAVEPREYMEMVVASLGLSNPAKLNFVFFAHYDYSSPLVDMLGMKYLVTSSQMPISQTQSQNVQRFKPVWRNDYCAIYENAEVLPAAYWAENVVVIKEKEDRLRRISEWRGKVREVILEEPLTTSIGGGNTDIELLRQGAEEMRYRVSAPRGGLLVLAYPWSSGWSAYIDGTETDLLKANHGLIALSVQSGKHLIHLKYRPPWLFHGILGSCIALIFFLGLVKLSRGLSYSGGKAF